MRTLPAGGTALWADPDQAYRAVTCRDPRFDGRFITAVRTTGIYCRPSCPARTPKRANVRFFATAAAAQAAGYRACRRCLPDAVPGSPDWNLRGDVASRAMKLIADGVVERDGVVGLAATLGYSTRQLNRVLGEELGAGPLALARAHRAHTARMLIETTPMAFTDVAFAAGFASVRQFNDTIQAVFGCSPTRLRVDTRAPRSGAGTLTIRLAFRPPLDAAGLVGFLSARAIPGVESVTESRYSRSMRCPHGHASVHLTPSDTHLKATLRLADLRDLGAAVARLRGLADLDADPEGIDTLLAADPALAPSVRAFPGVRVPGSVDGAEILLRALIGQQVSVAAARTALARVTAELGERLEHPDGDVTTLFPTPAAIAEHGGHVLRGPRRRVAAVLAAGAALASGTIDPHVGRDADELRAQLEAQPGIGPWTAGYVLMRVLAAPDVLLSSDLALRRGAERRGLPTTPQALLTHSRRWQPWRSYAGMHLWRSAATTIRQEGTR